MTTTVSEKGQITIPKRMRDQLGIRAGTVLTFRVSAGELRATKAETRDVIAKWRGRGRLPGAQSVDAYLRTTRGT